MISIIIPVYNAEKYIEKCILSLFQTKNAEIIAVDDNSTDSTLQILSKYKDKIKIIKNEENIGQGGTRNRGLLAACGEYVGFLDNDDWVDPNYFNYMVNEIGRTGAEICVARGIINYAGGRKKGQLLPSDTDLRKAVFVERTAPWAKIYRRDFLLKNKIFFGNGRGEDILPAFLCAYFAKKIAFCPNNFKKSPARAFYHCQIRENSVSHKKIIREDLNELLIYKEIFEFLKSNGLKDFGYWKKLVELRGMISFDFLYRAAPDDLKSEVLAEYEAVFNIKMTREKYLFWKAKRRIEKTGAMINFYLKR